MLKKSIISAAIIGVAVIVLASSGGGKKRTAMPATPVFASLRSPGLFTLKSKTDYAGSQGFSRMNTRNSVMYRYVVTYQKGNTIYVLPSTYRVSNAPSLGMRSNLNVIDLKIRLSK